MVGENGSRRGPGCERSGTCTVEVHSQYSGVEAEGEGSCEIRKDSMLYTVRCRGSALDRSAVMILMNKSKVANEIDTHVCRVVGHRDDFKLGVAGKEYG